MKKLFLLISVLIMSFAPTWADDQVTFEFSDGIDGPLKTKMEQQMSKLLTAINRAASTNNPEINFSGIQFERSEIGSQTISMLWNNVHFHTQDDDFYQKCLRHRRGSRVTGYQVRGIYMDMKPIDNSYEEELSQEFVFDFDVQGRVSDVNIAKGKLQYEKLLQEGEKLKDFDRREQIVKFCEDFANAYCKMDINFMEDIFSDDALIITGKVRERTKASITMNKDKEVKLPKKHSVDYTVHTKEEYLSNLRNVFNAATGSGYVNVKFSDYEIMHHGAKPNYYSVTLRQSWKSKNRAGKKYEDEGVVFLIWDFSDEEHPKIQVRTWQDLESAELDPMDMNRFKLR